MWRTSSNAADSTGSRLPTESASALALVRAARDNMIDEVSELIAAGVCLEAGQSSGYTALGLACNRGHLRVAELLLTARADPDTRICGNGATPLMIAVVWDQRDIIKLLLQHRASLDVEGYSGTYRGLTPLAVARERRRSEAAEVMVQARAQRRLVRLARLARHVGAFAVELTLLFNKVHFRPAGIGAQRASASFHIALQRYGSSGASPMPTSGPPAAVAPSDTATCGVQCDRIERKHGSDSGPEADTDMPPDTCMRLACFAEFEGWARLKAQNLPLLMRLPPHDLAPTRLACGERIGPIHRGNAKLFYEKRHEVSGELERALTQLASCGLHVTERHPICGYQPVVNADRAAARRAVLERGVPYDPCTFEPLVERDADGVGEEDLESYVQPHGVIVDRQPIFFGDRVILQYEGVPLG